MNRKLRVTFRTGDVRMVEMHPGRTLIDVWIAIRRDNAMVGELWCAQFDHIAMIEVVEMADETRPEAAPSPTFGSIDRLAVVTGTGIFKPPGDA